MDTKALEEARAAVAELEAKLFEEVKEKAALLGIDLEHALDISLVQKPKRKRRTKAEIASDNANQGGE